jgi:hypothetical protein
MKKSELRLAIAQDNAMHPTANGVKTKHLLQTINVIPSTLLRSYRPIGEGCPRPLP